MTWFSKKFPKTSEFFKKYKKIILIILIIILIVLLVIIIVAAVGGFSKDKGDNVPADHLSGEGDGTFYGK